MCHIRVIFKNTDGLILKDDTYKFDNLDISPIDRPFYVTCVAIGSKYILRSYFNNKSERFLYFQVNDSVKFQYGIFSGRIIELETTKTRIFPTTKYKCMESMPDKLSIRIKKNIQQYLNLYDDVLMTLEGSTKYVYK